MDLRLDKAHVLEHYKQQNAEVHRLWKYKQYSKALGILEELRRDPWVARLEDKRIDVLYNLACAYARLGKNEAAIDYLEQAEAAGLRHYKLVTSDPDLESIRGTLAYRRLVERIEAKSEPACAEEHTQ
jgi:hypothetical protein